LKCFIFFLFALAACKSADKVIINDGPVNVNDLLETRMPEAVKNPSPFNRGVNFSEWFEARSAEGIVFSKYCEQDFADAKGLGVEVIRLPIRMHDMTGPGPDYKLSSLLLRFLDKAVDWAEKYKIYIIIDNHSFDTEKDTAKDIDKILLSVWAQMARHFKNRSDYVLYEILNEPHGISAERWGEIQGMAINTIRAYDTRHAIVVGGVDFNSIGQLQNIPNYEDKNLIYTFHFYDPFMFTHQGAIWSPPNEYLGDVPFPYNAARMPKLHAKLRGTRAESNLKNNYVNEATPEFMRSTLDRVVTFANERNVRIFCGEFGVYDLTSPEKDRVLWYQVVTDMLARRNISRTSWDYFGSFGIFDKSGGKDFNRDLNVDVVRALGFTPPAQLPKNTVPLETGFVIYDDYSSREYPLGCRGGGGTVFNMYDTDACQGEFCIRWGNVDQYNIFWVSLARGKNFSKLLDSNFAVEFYAKTDTALSFHIRFVNPESSDSIPWRMIYAIDEKILPPDGKWHKISVPLKEMKEQGAWVNATQKWLNPKGEFTWENVYQFEFVSEVQSLKNKYIRFDEIKITKVDQ